MQKIEFQAPTGAELRQQMLDFLGVKEGSVNVTSDSPEVVIQKDVNTEKEETSAETTGTTRKRRTRAEIEAEKAANAQSEDQANQDATASEPDGDDEPETPTEVEVGVAEQDNGPEITKAFLTDIVISKGREGKKAQMLPIFASFKQTTGEASTGLPNLKPEDYARFYELVKDL